MSTAITRILAISRIGVGIPSILFPLATASSFFLALQSSSTIFFRMAGGRDIALGYLLWSTQNSSATTQRRVLMAGMTVDAIDILSSAACLYEGNLELLPASILGGGALSLIGLASWRYRQLAALPGTGGKL